MSAAFNRGDDLHRLTASKVLCKPAGEVTKSDRQIAKGINFGLLFGSGAEGLRGYCRASYGVTISEEQSVRFREAFMRAYPKIAQWQAEAKHRAYKGGCQMAFTKIGRRCLFDDGASDWRRFSTTLSVAVQGTCADGLKMAMIALARELPATAHIVATLHDEIMVECDVADKPSVADLTAQVMQREMSKLLPGVKIETESK